ncbi:GNAT domain [Phaffia rhodozyma]|uniref:GNAT domain n=1 Tax=Phaffia rhodozyma TaxID=264483 RepID=A0A0F7SUY8_PHARH|nr:GNAT domain [Phaffia rhodozyma]
MSSCSLAFPLPSSLKDQLPLREPHADICLTTYFLPTDAPQMVEILNKKDVSWNLTGPPWPYTLQMAEGWIEQAEERADSGAERRGPIVIRTINSLSSPCPKFLGTICIVPNPFTHVQDLSLRAKRVAENMAKKDDEKSWAVGYYLDPAWNGKGVMSTVLEVVLEYYVHQENLDPRRVIGHAFADNIGSIKVMMKNNFQPLYLSRSTVPASESKPGQSSDMCYLAWVPDKHIGYDESLWTEGVLESFRFPTLSSGQ